MSRPLTPHTVRLASLMALSLIVCLSLTGCLVAGYSSGSGFWMWPGSIVITLVLVLIWFLSRR